MSPSHQPTISRRSVLLGVGAALSLGATSSGGAAQTDSVPLTPEHLVTAVKANQIVFEPSPSGSGLITTVKCGQRVTLDDVAKTARLALVATEDRRFFSHRGFDPLTIPSVLAGGIRRGASTLTMQLVKNTVLSPVRSYDWFYLRLKAKLDEVSVAYMLEECTQKEEILQHYLNAVNFGHLPGGVPITGIETAARYYFGRTAGDLDLYQSAVLAGILKAPSRLNPRDHPEATHERAAVVLGLMTDQGMISHAQADKALRSRRRRGTVEPMFVEARDFVGWVLTSVKRDVPGFRAKPYSRVLITLQGETQFRARDTLDSMVAAGDSRADAAFVSMAHSGRVVSMVGQRDYEKSQLNYAVDTLRPAASTFKAVVYLTALERGVERVSNGLITDFAKSHAPRAKELASKAGGDNVIAMARKLGITSPLRDDGNLALGGSGVSLLEMTSAYTAFASLGMLASSFGYVGIIEDGRMISWRGSPSTHRVFSEGRGEEMHRLLRAVVTQGTGAPARRVPEAAGKTGTSVGPRDAWFIGYTPKHVSGVWVGHPDNTPMPAHLDGTAAAEIWASVEQSLPTS